MLKHYPKLTLVVLTYLLAFGVFVALGPDAVHTLIEPLGIGGIIIAGALYTYGFTASIGAVLLIALIPSYPPIMLALLGGCGAILADITIFKFFKGPLHAELDIIAKMPVISTVIKYRALRKKWVRNVAGFFIIASPLPDEIGVALITTMRMNERTFLIVGFCANVLGIYLLALAGAWVY